MIRPAALCLALSASAAPVLAQTTPSTTSTDSVQFLPRAAFHLTAEHLSHDDERFVWDTGFGGDLDIVDYGSGRVLFEANYEAVLGEEFRSFDPNQGNYVLGGLASARMAGLEFSGEFHHESRHLSDRFKRIPVNWNMFGVRVYKQATSGTTQFLGHGVFRRVVQKSFVDYTWEAAGGMRSQSMVAPHAAVITSVDVQVLGVDNSRNRQAQRGLRVEGGMQFEGNAGAVEVFVAAERRIDPYPLEFSTATWVSVGFRLLNR